MCALCWAAIALVTALVFRKTYYAYQNDNTITKMGSTEMGSTDIAEMANKQGEGALRRRSQGICVWLSVIFRKLWNNLTVQPGDSYANLYQGDLGLIMGYHSTQLVIINVGVSAVLNSWMHFMLLGKFNDRDYFQILTGFNCIMSNTICGFFASTHGGFW